MFPFSVLRFWLVGILGWALLGTGIYLLAEWWNRGGVPPWEATPETVAHRSDDAADQRMERPQPGRREDSYFLVGGLALVLLSSGGFTVPVWILMTSRRRKAWKSSLPLDSRQVIQRPDGSELSVVHLGPAAAPTLLLTHGWTLDKSDWLDLCEAFRDRYHLVLWDLAGLGDSSQPQNADHSLEKMAGDLEAVLTQATSGPVILVGHSIGGMIQQTFCRLYPQHSGQRVRGLVLVHTTYTNPSRTVIASPLFLALQKPVLEPLTHLMIGLAPLAWLSNWQSYWNGSLQLSTRLSSFAGHQTWEQIDHVSRLQARAWPAVTGRGMLAMTRFDEQATLPNIDLPALVVGGSADRLTRSDASETLNRLLPQAQLVMLEGGHFGHWEQSEKFHRALDSFVDYIRESDSVRGIIAIDVHRGSPLRFKRSRMMIVRSIESGWEIIYQSAHALLASQIATQLQQLPRISYWAETLAAIADHDDHKESFGSNVYLTDLGAPKDFTQVQFTAQERFREVQRRIEHGYRKHRWLGLLAARHAEELYREVKVSQRLDKLLKAEQQRRPALLKELETTEAALEAAYAVLQWCDRTSLILCQSGIPAMHRRIEIAPLADRRRYELWQADDETVAVSPWPFQFPRFEVHVEVRSLHQLTFQSDRELERCLQSGEIEDRRWTFKQSTTR